MMKSYILLLAMPLLLSFNTKAQDMNEVLKKTFLAFDTTQDVTVKTAQANKLSLIAKKWKGEWAPHYYVAYAKANLSYYEQDATKKDAYVDEAEAELGEAVSLLGKEDDEIHVLKAMLAQARMAVDGKNRWQTQGKIFEENLRAAKEVNEENPRIYYLMGTSKYFTPKAFGGGPKKALEYFEKASGYFANESTDNMEDPFWGKYANEYFIAQCTKPEKEDVADSEKIEE